MHGDEMGEITHCYGFGDGCDDGTTIPRGEGRRVLNGLNVTNKLLTLWKWMILPLGRSCPRRILEIRLLGTAVVVSRRRLEAYMSGESLRVRMRAGDA